MSGASGPLWKLPGLRTARPAPGSECCTVYLGVRNRPDDANQIFYSRDCGQCWNEPPATKIDIQDFCVESENIVYVIDDQGMLSMSTQYGRRWSDAVDTGLDSGYTITSCCNLKICKNE